MGQPEMITHTESVEWIDSADLSGWNYADQIMELLRPARVTSHGYVIEETGEYLVIAGTRGENAISGEACYMGALAIPKDAIVSRSRWIGSNEQT